jgi:hypothetical protein
MLTVPKSTSSGTCTFPRHRFGPAVGGPSDTPPGRGSRWSGRSGQPFESVCPASGAPRAGRSRPSRQPRQIADYAAGEIMCEPLWAGQLPVAAQQRIRELSSPVKFCLRDAGEVATDPGRCACRAARYRRPGIARSASSPSDTASELSAGRRAGRVLADRGQARAVLVFGQMIDGGRQSRRLVLVRPGRWLPTIPQRSRGPHAVCRSPRLRHGAADESGAPDPRSGGWRGGGGYHRPRRERPRSARSLGSGPSCRHAGVALAYLGSCSGGSTVADVGDRSRSISSTIVICRHSVRRPAGVRAVVASGFRLSDDAAEAGPNVGRALARGLARGRQRCRGFVTRYRKPQSISVARALSAFPVARMHKVGVTFISSFASATAWTHPSLRAERAPRQAQLRLRQIVGLVLDVVPNLARKITKSPQIYIGRSPA